MDDVPLLTIHQAAKFLNVSETSLRRWTNDGRLACVRIGKKDVRRFRKEDLVAFLRVQPSASDSARRSLDSPGTVIGGFAVKHGTHLCSLYTNEEGRAKAAINFLGDGLQHNCACYLICAPPECRDILAKLKKHKPDYQKDIDAGRLVIMEYMDSAQTQLKKLEASLKSSLAKGAKHIRLVGDVSHGRLAKTNSFDHLLKYEKDFDMLCKRYPLVSLCQYDARRHTGAELTQALKMHPDLFSYPSDRIIF